MVDAAAAAGVPAEVIAPAAAAPAATGPATAPQPVDGKDPPKSFEWYVDSARWLIAIDSGALAFGFDALKDNPHGAQLQCYAIAAGLLIASAACALLYMFNSYNYASMRSVGASKDSADAKALYKLCNWLFAGMIWCFALGFVVFITFGVAHLNALGKTEYGPSSQIQAVAAGSKGLAILQDKGHLWILEPGPAGKGYVWRRLPEPPET